MEAEYNDLPVIEQTVADVYAMGIVTKAANLRDDIMLFSDETVELDTFLFSKEDSEKQIITGIAMVPNLKIFRKYPEPHYVWFSESTIEEAALLYFKNHHQTTTTLEHQVNVNGNTTFESWIVTDPEMDKTKKLGFKDVVKGSWVISMKIEDKVLWNEYIKTGILKGFSIEMTKNKFNKNNNEEMTLKSILNFFNGKQVETFETQDNINDVVLFALDFLVGDSKVTVDEQWIATIDGEIVPEGEITVSTPDKAADFMLEVGMEGKVLKITTPWGLQEEVAEEVVEETVVTEELSTETETEKMEIESEKFKSELETSTKLINELKAEIEAMKLKANEPLNIKSKDDKWVESEKTNKPSLTKILKERKKKERNN